MEVACYYLQPTWQGGAVKAKVTANVRAMVRKKDNILRSAATLVEQAITHTEGSGIDCFSPAYMVRSVNYL